MTGPTETEVKIRLAGTDGIHRSLESAGLVISVPRQFESNTIYDTDDNKLRQQGVLLRLRQVGSKNVITWKGRVASGPYKSRPELETTIGSLETLQSILTELGFHPFFKYEKYRTEFAWEDEAGVVTLDETPIGDFLELEGAGDWIDRTAHRLGFSRRDYVVESYGRLYLADCERRGVQPTHMVFTSYQ